jgi:rod shape determining protein RodA
MNKLIVYLKNFDWIIIFTVLLLICFGLIELYSIALSQNYFDLENFKKQLLFVGIGFIILFFLAFIDYQSIRSSTLLIYIAGALVLFALLFFGRTVRGTRGWFSIGGFLVQPVEFIKIILILFLARYFSQVDIREAPWKHLILTGASAGFLAGLVMLQPDFGSGMLLIFIWLAMLMLAGFNKKYLIAIFLVISLTATGAWLFVFKDYQKQRILTFVDPSRDPLYRGYNSIQAMIAVGSGGLIGRGVGFGSQSQLKFLPESQNDFIFAVIAEELGFFGVALVVLFFSIFFLRFFINIRKLKDPFTVYFLIGASVLIFVEMFINIAMNIGLLPVVGISLPFVSYGGSSIISTLAIIGLAQSMIIREKIKY